MYGYVSTEETIVDRGWMIVATKFPIALHVKISFCISLDQPASINSRFSSVDHTRSLNDIGLFKMFLRWILGIFNAQMQSEKGPQIRVTYG